MWSNSLQTDIFAIIRNNIVNSSVPDSLRTRQGLLSDGHLAVGLHFQLILGTNKLLSVNTLIYFPANSLWELHPYQYLLDFENLSTFKKVFICFYFDIKTLKDSEIELYDEHIEMINILFKDFFPFNYTVRKYLHFIVTEWW